MKRLFFYSYSIFLLAFTVFSYAFIDPNLTYLHKIYSGFVFQNRPLTAIIYILFIALFFIFYFIFLRKIILKKVNLMSVYRLIFITVFILFFSYPAMLSYDIFNYILSAKVLFFYHENPYIIMPIEFVGDPLLLFTHAANKIVLYGPIWLLLTSVPYYLGNLAGFLFLLFSFKLFVVLFHIGTIFIIWKMSKSLLSVSLFALNPLVVIETLVSGHNDIVMMFFVLCSFFLLSKKKLGFAFIFFVLSVFIKYATLFLIPVFLYILLKKIQKKEISWERIYFASAIFMILALLLSPIREEIYPWYAIWFLPFIALIPKNKVLLYISISFSFGLLFRYVPFMLLGTYFGPTPIIKILVTFIPLVIAIIFILLKQIWVKKPVSQ